MSQRIGASIGWTALTPAGAGGGRGVEAAGFAALLSATAASGAPGAAVKIAAAGKAAVEQPAPRPMGEKLASGKNVTLGTPALVDAARQEELSEVGRPVAAVESRSGEAPVTAHDAVNTTPGTPVAKQVQRAGQHAVLPAAAKQKSLAGSVAVAEQTGREAGVAAPAAVAPVMLAPVAVAPVTVSAATSAPVESATVPVNGVVTAVIAPAMSEVEDVSMASPEIAAPESGTQTAAPGSLRTTGQHGPAEVVTGTSVVREGAFRSVESVSGDRRSAVPAAPRSLPVQSVVGRPVLGGTITEEVDHSVLQTSADVPVPSFVALAEPAPREVPSASVLLRGDEAFAGAAMPSLPAGKPSATLDPAVLAGGDRPRPTTTRTLAPLSPASTSSITSSAPSTVEEVKGRPGTRTLSPAVVAGSEAAEVSVDPASVEVVEAAGQTPVATLNTNKNTAEAGRDEASSPAIRSNAVVPGAGPGLTAQRQARTRVAGVNGAAKTAAVHAPVVLDRAAHKVEPAQLATAATTGSGSPADAKADAAHPGDSAVQSGTAEARPATAGTTPGIHPVHVPAQAEASAPWAATAQAVHAETGPTTESAQLYPTEVRTLEASAGTLEVGVSSGTHGWLRVRAEMGHGGEVTASMIASSGRAAEALHRELPGLGEYLAREQVGVSSIAVAATQAAGAATADATSGGGQALAGGMTGGQAGHQQQLQQGSNGEFGRGSGSGWTGSGRGTTEASLDGVAAGAAGMPVLSRGGMESSGGWVNVRV